MTRLILSTVAATIILFLWSGLTQMLPWGVTATQNISVQTNQPVQAPNLLRLEPNSLTTETFDEQFINKISTYTTDKTFSWIVTQPLNTNYLSYFVREAFAQFLVAFFLSMLLFITVKLNLKTRLSLITLAGLAAVTTTYGQLMNWWKLPASYALGVGLNLMIGWLLASFIVAKFIMKTKE